MEQVPVQTELISLKKRRRFWELDFLRGLCVILMVFDHAMFTISSLMPSFNKAFWGNAAIVAGDFFYGEFRASVRLVVLFCFFILCGISCTLSRSNLKRGGLCFLVGCGITFFTVMADMIFDLGVSIYFGVLHMLGVSILLYGILDKLGALIAKPFKNKKTKKIIKTIGEYIAPTVGLISFIIFFAIFYSGMQGDMFGTSVVIEDESMSLLASLFIPIQSSYAIGGADVWTLFPWASIVLMGGFIGRSVYNNPNAQNYLARLDGRWNSVICFIGKHALIIYALHQVIIFGGCYLITLIAT